MVDAEARQGTMEQNIFTTVVTKAKPKVIAYIDNLDKDGQIDRDERGKPVIIGFTEDGPTVTIEFKRNGKNEFAVLNTRRKDMVAYYSWNENDGFRRTDKNESAVEGRTESDGAFQKERAKKSDLYETILRGIS